MHSKEENKIDLIEISKLNNNSLELLKTGKLEEALDTFSQVLKKYYSDSIAESGVKCIKYWMHRLSKTDRLPDNSEKGIYLYDEWKKFEKFVSLFSSFHEKTVDSIMFYIFKTILDAFNNDIENKKMLSFDSKYIIALSYKKIGDFKNSIKFFEETLELKQNDYNTIAQLADCYALIDEEIKAKLLFREAFFSDPASIILNDLESNIINFITTKIIEEKKYIENINYYIPVYGRIFNIFIIFRELLAEEVFNIENEIKNIEKAIINDGDNDLKLKMRLINHYFWMYDYYSISNKEKKVNELENKIKNTDIDIYNIFKNNLKYKGAKIEY